MGLAGKTAVVTGASRGIGAAVARMLHQMLDVNLKGTIYTIRAALPHMLGREGDVITVSEASWG